MEMFISFMFWWMVFGVVVRSIFLLGEHPRVVNHSVGADCFGLIASIILLAWVAWLKYAG